MLSRNIGGASHVMSMEEWLGQRWKYLPLTKGIKQREMLIDWSGELPLWGYNVECVILQPVSLIADSKNTSSTLVKVCCACVNLCPSGILIIKIVKKNVCKNVYMMIKLTACTVFSVVLNLESLQHEQQYQFSERTKNPASHTVKFLCLFQISQRRTLSWVHPHLQKPHNYTTLSSTCTCKPLPCSLCWKLECIRDGMAELVEAAALKFDAATQPAR